MLLIVPEMMKATQAARWSWLSLAKEAVGHCLCTKQMSANQETGCNPYRRCRGGSGWR